MTPDDPPEDAPDWLASVREAIETREGATLVEIRDSNARSVEVIVEESGSEGPQRVLYRVEHESEVDDGDHLHWVRLGGMVDGGDE